MYLLIHSPLVGTFTWSRVAEEMRRRGIAVRVPQLRDTTNANTPLWKQYAAAVAIELEGTPSETRVILVGHSGAGPLLPAIARASPRPVVGYVFVDAGILLQDGSHLDLRAMENAEAAEAFAEELRRGVTFPMWTDEDLREEIPGDAARAQMVREIRPRGLDFFTERMPVYDFPDAPCAYLQFTPWYDAYAAEAKARGWAFEKMEAGHFHMLVDPVRVTDAIVELARESSGVGKYSV